MGPVQTKMQYVRRATKATEQIVIHYNVKIVRGVIKKTADFKFKKP